MIIGICTSDDSLSWLIVLFIYKGSILLIGVFLSFETRKVKIASLNESCFIGMSVYGTFIVSIALTPIGFFMEDIPNAQYAIIGIMILASITIILILVFVTKACKFQCVYCNTSHKMMMIIIIITNNKLNKININNIKLIISQMYKVYHDPEGKSEVTSYANPLFQHNENMYKEQIQKLNKEVVDLRKVGSNEFIL